MDVASDNRRSGLGGPRSQARTGLPGLIQGTTVADEDRLPVTASLPRAAPCPPCLRGGSGESLRLWLVASGAGTPLIDLSPFPTPYPLRLTSRDAHHSLHSSRAQRLGGPLSQRRTETAP